MEEFTLQDIYNTAVLVKLSNLEFTISDICRLCGVDIYKTDSPEYQEVQRAMLEATFTM